MADPTTIDPTLLAGLIGAGGSVIGALAGTILGYKLSNSKADLNAYVDNRIVIYYLKNVFSMYLPITITNEGSKSSTVSDFRVTLISPTNQKWELFWYCFAEDNTHKNEPWSDGRRATPILIHGNSGGQYFLKLIEIGSTSDGLSNVSLPAGSYTLLFKFFDRAKNPVASQGYKFEIGTEAHEALSKLRKDKEDLSTWIIPVQSI